MDIIIFQTKKIVVTILIASLVLFSLAACQISATNIETKAATTKTASITRSETSTSESVSFTELAAASIQTVLEIPLGENDGELSYGDIGDDRIADSGPNDFAVADNGDIYILDNYHGGAGRIAIFSQGKWQKNLDYQGQLAYGCYLTIFNDQLYIFDHNYYQGDAYIVRLTQAGQLAASYVYSQADKPIDVNRLQLVDGRLLVVTYDGCFELDEANKKAVKSELAIKAEYMDKNHRQVTLGNTSWNLVVEEGQKSLLPLAKNKDNELFILCGGNDYVLKSAADGKPLGILRLADLLEDTVFMQNRFYLAADGSFYFMVGHKDAVRIYKVFWI